MSSLLRNILERAVARVGGHRRNRIDHLTGGVIGDLAENRVLALQPLGGSGGDEELGAIG